MDVKTTLLNPVKMIEELYTIPKGSVLGHIKYDPKLNDDFDYQIIRSMTHDGSHVLTYTLLGEVLENLVYKKSSCVKDNLTNAIDVIYYVGDIKLESEHVNGKIEQVASIPVKCEYIRGE